MKNWEDSIKLDKINWDSTRFDKIQRDLVWFCKICETVKLTTQQQWQQNQSIEGCALQKLCSLKYALSKLRKNCPDKDNTPQPQQFCTSMLKF